MGRRKAPVIFSSVLIGVAVLVPFGWVGIGGVVLTAALAGLGFGIYLSVDAALMTEVLPSSADRAKDLGILNIANTGGQVIAPVVASVTVGIGGYRPLFVVAAVVAIGSALCIRPIRSVR
jgi:MFS family permease